MEVPAAFRQPLSQVWKGSNGRFFQQRSIDKSMLSSILTVENVAYYSVAVFIAAVIEIPGRAMFQILSPVVADAIKQSNKLV